MFIFLTGLVLFFGAHFIPLFPAGHALQQKLDDKQFKGIIALPSLVGAVLIVMGYQHSSLQPLWYPVPYAREIALVLMPVSFVLLAAAHMKSNIKRFIKHPMLAGVLLWAIVHLLNNGELRATILFACFAVYCVVDWIFTKKLPGKPVSYPIKKDVIVIVAGIFAYAIALHIHHSWAGIRLF